MTDSKKHYCWECNLNEIPAPEYCCVGGNIYPTESPCGCGGWPIDPPYCDECIEKKTGWKLITEESE